MLLKPVSFLKKAAASSIITVHDAPSPIAFFNASSHTFTGVGGASASRRIIIIAFSEQPGLTATIGGVTANVTELGLGTYYRTYLMEAVVASGTSIALVASNTVFAAALFYGDVNITDTGGAGGASSAATISASVNVAAGGSVIGGHYGWFNNGLGGSADFSADNLTKEHEIDFFGASHVTAVYLEEGLSAATGRTTVFTNDNSPLRYSCGLVAVEPA